MKQQSILFTNNTADALSNAISVLSPTNIFVLTDENTLKYVWPVIQSEDSRFANLQPITIPAGDINKNLESTSNVWNELQKGGATRHSALICLGGGVITDLGGFAASTFKRGIKFINMPTTLLSAVDAAVGGKTGINFNGYKNEIGVFSPADYVIISTRFFSTLPQSELLSGYAEMLKHGLIDSAESFNALLNSNPCSLSTDEMLQLLETSVNVKRRIVADDPYEHGIRRALNLGHTAGHALESLAMKNGRPVPHGYAVAWGCVIELILSHMQCGFPTTTLRHTAKYISDNYGAPSITCTDYPVLIEYMRHDKKNTSPQEINFTLLSDIGKINIDCRAKADEIKTALDIFRDLLGI
ncbi:MAG: 3-dehydroquinate synthase [Muribaculum sp.]|nr:3-dehydroquinate synthase [Muribaculaceae bacterium]MCM1080801.1 3-dehydroquinate synthase [Muribaculum sp.]